MGIAAVIGQHAKACPSAASKERIQQQVCPGIAIHHQQIEAAIAVDITQGDTPAGVDQCRVNAAWWLNSKEPPAVEAAKQSVRLGEHILRFRPEPLIGARDWIDRQQKFWKQGLEALDAVLAAETDKETRNDRQD